MHFLIMLVVWILCFILNSFKDVNCSDLPLVMNTWGFARSTSSAWCKLNSIDGNYLEALVDGCSLCEREQCDGTVGFGGSPDESGETTLDAMIMDGSTMNIGAVAGLRNIKDAISVAYHVLKYTDHTMLVGEGATNFAKMMGFKSESLQTSDSIKIWNSWKQKLCQPNYWLGVIPDSKTSCGPYSPIKAKGICKFVNCEDKSDWKIISEKNHDTIGMIIIDKNGNIGVGTSTNGAVHKISGRVGDSAIPGAGAYADSNIGAAASTGDGDIMMRFLPSFVAVERIRAGNSPEQAAEFAISRIAKHFPNFVGAIIAANKQGQYAAACHGLESFPYSVFKPGYNFTIVNHVKCLKF